MNLPAPIHKNKQSRLLAALRAEAKEMFFPNNWEDTEFMDDIRQATLRGAHPLANLLLWVIVAIFLFFIIWANIAELDEVTRGAGSVIPSGKTQTVQNLEGGIVKQLLVKEGDVVERDQTLLELDNTGFASSYEEKKTRARVLEATIARLEAFVESREPVFSEQLKTEAPQIVEQQLNVFQSDRAQQGSSIDVLKQQVVQRRQELAEAVSNREKTANAYNIAQQELDMTLPLEAKGAVSKVEILRLQRQVSDLDGARKAASLNIPRAQAALQEAEQRVNESSLQNKNDKVTELAKVREDFQRVTEIIKAEADKVDRTTVKAPVRGTVKQLLVNTVGGVVQPGMDLVEIIPLDDSLLVEAQIRPKDIAFLRPGQEATVKITAYDFSIYGGLKGRLERISADTITNEKGDPFYKIVVRTDKAYLGGDKQKLPIIPGMVASVDILTGKKTVMDYIAKPFLKAYEEALKEK